MLQFTDLSLRRGPRLLIDKASFTIYRGEKVGIVGHNGCGKSTLMALMLGELQPDGGNFDMPSNLVVAHVAQELDATDRHAIEFVMDGDVELRATEERIA
jgi:ATP-binding cassette subfamily F protein 3